MNGQPDWSIVARQRTGDVWNISGSVDANITNSQLDVNVTNSKLNVDANVTNSSLDVNVKNSQLDVNVTNSDITIKPESGTVFTISPDSTAVFDVKGNVDANITNSNLDVNVTNSSLDVNVQGTTSISVDNATVTVDVATVKEKASETGKVVGSHAGLNLKDYDNDSKTIYTNNTGGTVYLEAISAAEGGVADLDTGCFVEIQICNSEGFSIATFYANIQNFPLNFDPAFPIPDGGYINVYAERNSISQYILWVSVLIRTS